jgi:hypothetical protein
MAVLISHFKNEAVLLPHWLAHHRRLFRHGVMIDYGSTDGSVDIIREMAPTWEVRPTVNPLGSADGGTRLDAEVEAVEAEFDGWKMVLNTPEFLVLDDLDAYIARFEAAHPDRLGVRTTGVILVDPAGGRWSDWTAAPLVLQHTVGYLEREHYTLPYGSPKEHRNRLLHRAWSGLYELDRHDTRLPGIEVDPTLFLAWFGTGFPALKLHRNRGIVDSTGWSGHHKWGEADILDHYRREAAVSYSLPDRHPEYRAALDRVAKAQNA